MTINYRLTVLAGAVALACSAWAQQPSSQYPSDQYSAGQYQDVSQNQVDPPTRVARLAYLSGEVSFAPGGENDWVSAQRNRPLTTGDKLYTDNGRAELQIGTSSIFLNQRSNMDFLTLNDQMTQVELTQGSLNINVRRLRSGEVYEVDTPTIAFVADQVGSYRIDVDANGQTTTVSVTRGSGDAVGEGGNRVRIDEGTRVVFNDSQLNDYQSVDLRAGDGFDTYVTERVARYERAPARRYVSEEVVGYEDLEDHGSWEDAPEYGHVWYPHGVAADWAPYHDGNWVWEDPWGWTWVDNSDWGFAPFHYGRWAYVGSRWGWVPGPVDVRPVYAPALVAFVGGGGFGLDIAVGGPIGWFALGPRDVYFPSYSVGRDYFRNVNVSNTVVNNTVINNYYGAFSAGNVNYAQINYANRMAPRAVTAVPTNAFVSGRPVAASAIAMNSTQLANARVMSRATVAPTAASLVASRARATPPPATAMNRTVVAANRPAPAPAPFAQRQAMLRQHPGQPLTPAQLRTVAGSAPARGGAATATATVPTRPNVRLANRTAANAPVVNARANANAHATANAPGNNRAAPQPVPMNARQQAQANQQTQANGRANAQAQGHVQGTLPSSRYTQPSRGTAPRESATAQQNAAANARFNRGNAPPTTPTPRESATAQQNAAANARFNRGNAPPATAANAAQNRGAEARANAQQRAQAQAQQQNRANDQRTAAQQHAQQQQERASTRRMEAQTRANESRANAQAQQRSRASDQQQRMAQQRAQQQQERASTQRMEAQTRANESRANAQAQQRSRASEQQQRSQARVQQQQEQRAQAQTQRAPVQQREQAPVQQRAQAQYREPPRPTSQPQPRPAQQQTSQQRQQAKRKSDKDRDPQNGGGG